MKEKERQKIYYLNSITLLNSIWILIFLQADRFIFGIWSSMIFIYAILSGLCAISAIALTWFMEKQTERRDKTE